MRNLLFKLKGIKHAATAVARLNKAAAAEAGGAKRPSLISGARGVGVPSAHSPEKIAEGVTDADLGYSRETSELLGHSAHSGPEFAEPA